VQKELPPTGRLVVEAVGGRVGGNVGAEEPELTALGASVGLTDVGAAIADGLDLAAGEDKTRLYPLQHIIVVEGLAVDGDSLLGHGRASRRDAIGPETGV
jgi:hypothetical protein